MTRIYNELKSIGMSYILILIFVSIVYIVIAYTSGDLIDLSLFGAEVIFPIFASIIISECCKIKSDDNCDIIIAQCKSVFSWILIRFLTVFLVIMCVSILTIITVSQKYSNIPIEQLIIIWFAPTLFLSSLSIICSLHFKQSHVATTICGIISIITLLCRALLSIKGVEYIYLFICFTRNENDIWLLNKIIFIIVSLIIWGCIYYSCKKNFFAS